MKKNINLKEYSKKIADLIDKDKIKDIAELQKVKLNLASEFSISELPTNGDILSSIKNPSKKAHTLLTKKKTRSSSGIVSVAVMVKPHKCPGNCLYCPTSMVDSETPKSYTGREPATMRALQNNFDAYLQAKNRIEQLELIGHSAEKIQLIVMGGTFLSTDRPYQTDFVRKALNAVTEKNCKSFETAKKMAETSKRRVIGITYETRPDYCTKKEVDRMLELAGTHCEIGVQILNNEIYKKINRGHTVEEVIEATRNLKDAGFKVTYHTMPGLPFTKLQDDYNSFEEMFSNPDFRPDMLKIYPCLVVKSSKLYKLYKEGKYKPLDTEKAADMIANVKSILPKYVRIMRIQRDIPADLIVAGVKAGNLRQIVHEKLKRKNKKCSCIRCREIGLQLANDKIDLSKFGLDNLKLNVNMYEASKGTDLFISYDKNDSLYGFCRLRIPENSFRKEIKDKAAIIRELRVFGESVPLGISKDEAVQHRGLGSALIKEAEHLALNVFDRKKMVVISGLGVKQYYSKYHKYHKEGPYMAKSLI
ncbi:MAG: tRNA uridine(34) 5-carboxymethylaminomethyl modification radical SAM/GNAT enzyme Elp3 [Candidatus Diapherotrites archaeon CG08_land_8_20_14_0_20_34_12]|nr:MAG: tRNA uridine(34) 5-carboxymethylaminomethyl modification radical SAM/GNAT enzyme Elp3 [Candidatus Diapherotrites archaeon CG08_land_8_20_14_0_20_34_12]